MTNLILQILTSKLVAMATSMEPSEKWSQIGLPVSKTWKLRKM